MTDKIDQYATEIRHTVSTALLNFEIWWVYRGSDTGPKFINTMNKYPLFFQTSVDAHFVALLMALYRLYETRSETFNIPGFLRLLRVQQAISSEALTQLQHLYEEAKPIWVKVSILRNKAFGHRSNAHSVSDVFAEADVTADQLRSLVEVTQKLVNVATRDWAGTSHAFNLSSRADTVRLLNDLKSE